MISRVAGSRKPISNDFC